MWHYATEIKAFRCGNQLSPSKFTFLRIVHNSAAANQESDANQSDQ
jgi:hypothetical protein